jgi:hypothetical protein
MTAGPTPDGAASHPDARSPVGVFTVTTLRRDDTMLLAVLEPRNELCRHLVSFLRCPAATSFLLKNDNEASSGFEADEQES